ncbi:MAG: mechanosensitive ion channel [Pseudomonadales bacterium]|nr:mechanosensitive ion channel [Pseudomonadales bacterium]
MQFSLPDLSYMEWTGHALVFLINALLFLFAKPLIEIITTQNESANRIKILQFLNLFVFFLHIIDLTLLSANSNYQSFFIHLGLSVMSVYTALYCFSLSSFLSRKKFGQQKTLDDKIIYIDTYSTRVVDLMMLVIICVATIYALIKIWNADSLLETTGIFGISAAFLAFTSNIWAPDIFSGLIILNSQMLEDGHVVKVDGYKDEYIINKVSFIYIILYDVRNNHRTLIRNSHFIKSKIDNLSRVASTDGIRKTLIYNIGYPVIAAKDPDERLAELALFQKKIDRMFCRANKMAADNDKIKVNSKEFEWALTETGDYALKYQVWFYLERIPNTKLTAVIRKYLISTVYLVNEAIFKASIAENIDLSTPVIANINNT